MKHLFLLISLWGGLAYLTFAQKRDSTKRDTTLFFGNIVPPASNPNTYTPNLVLPSPQAATLGSYGNTPINLSSGLVTPSISLFDLKEGSIELGIGVSYQYKGFKPFESPSIIGRGWALNAGGVITRVIKSKPDEKRPISTSSHAYGYANPENRTNLANLINNDGTIVQPAGQSLFYSIPDGEPDMFIFNFMGMMGKFFFGEDGNIHVVSDRKLKIDYQTVTLTQFPANDPNIDKTHFVKFTITDENGTVYEFGDTSASVVLPIKNVEFSTSGSNFDCVGGSMNITSWYIATVRDRNGRKINFSYTNDYMYQSGANKYFDFTLRGRNNTSPVARGQYNTSQQTYSYDNIWNCVGSLENFLTSVKGSNWTVNFEYDKRGNVTYLTKATLLANTVPSQEIKKISFDFLNLANPDFLLLSTLAESSPDNSVIKQHTFNYSNSQNLSYQNPYAIDYWGFDNGANSNTSLIADAPFNAQRSPSLLNTLKGALTNINYPTGGSTEFIYEQNEYSQLRESEYENNVLIYRKPYGGLRVKTIIDTDLNGDVVSRKNYYYDSFDNANKSSGVISSSIGLTKLRYVDAPSNNDPTKPYFPVLPNKDFYYSEGLHSIAEIPIYYTNVTEALNDSSITKSVFTSHNDYNDFLGINFGHGNNQLGSPASYSMMRSVIKEVRYYKFNTLVKESINTYNLIDRHKARSLYTGNATAAPSISQSIDFLKTYYTYSGWFQKKSETERLYVGATDFIETVTNYNYGNSTYLQLTSIATQSSKGETLLMNYKYPYDFNTEPYLTMTSRNIITPIIEETDSLGNTQTAWKFTDYASFGTLFLPQQIRTKIGNGTVITPIIFNSYDARGNLTKYTTSNGQTTAMQYYGTLDLGKTDLLKSQTTGGGNTGTLLTKTIAFDYTPLIGLNQGTDINGYATTYAYDVFGRLKSIKDSQNYLLKDFNYHYANQPALSGLAIIPSNTMNYIVSRTAREEQATTTLDSDVNKTTTQIDYMDGIGRGVQSLLWKATPDKTKDLITVTTVFDAYGRAYKSILPTPSSSATAEYKSNAQSLGTAFYGDTYPFTETVFEASPLNRPFKQFGAGQAWRTANKFTQFDYWITGSQIVRFDIQANGSVTGNTRYPSSSLYNNVVTSERGTWTMEVKDKQGRVVSKLQQLEGNTLDFATTDYVYNDLGQLSYVIPPNIDALFQAGTVSSFTESDNVFLEGIYGYHYDKKGRLIKKHIPGAGWTRYVYDKNDRIVLENDDKDTTANLNYYKFTQYDALGRAVRTGLMTGIGSKNRDTIQTAFDKQSDIQYSSEGWGPFPSGYQPVDSSVKSVTYYDDYAWQTETAYNFQSTNAFHTQGLTKGLVTGALVRNLETNDWYKSVNYYDYKGRVIQSFSQNHLAGIDRTDFQYRFNNEVLKTRVVHNNSLQSITEIYEYTYDHVGRKTSFVHTKDGVSQKVAKYNYDAIGRMIQKVFKPAGSAVGSKQSGQWTDTNTWLTNNLPTINDLVTINNNHSITIPSNATAAAGSLIMGTNTNLILQSIGQLSMGSASTSNLQSPDYKYHIRGGLLGINLDANNDLTNSLFSFRLDYETGSDGFFDGNIRRQYWKSSLDGKQRAYEYSYDGASRIKSANYASQVVGENYALNSVNYDRNGNILALSRNGYRTNNTFGLIDNLAYAYNANSNKILKVDDISNETASFKDVTGNDYTYWEDGSLKSDNNKDISLIEYNYLKLPKRIVKGSTTILYQYDASGRKLRETIGTNVTDYVGNLIYKNNSLYQLSHDEGRAVNGVYEYNIKDHLGNLRVAFKDSLGVAKITQSNAYGIWGEDLPTLSYQNTANLNNFKFTGKENLLETGYIDFGARLYDNIVPRFISIDPLAEKYHGISTYHYVFNNPISLIDPDGRYVDVSGIYEKGRNGEYKHPELVEAFNNFASSEQGISFLSKFAQKGQVIAGYEYTKNGIYHTGIEVKGHNIRIDISFKTGDLKDAFGEKDAANGQTAQSLLGGKGQINIILNNLSSERATYSKNKNRNMYVWDLTETILHESFVHAKYDAEDMVDNGTIDKSNMPMINSYGIVKRQKQHDFFRDSYKKHPFSTQGLNLLIKLNKQYGIYPTNTHQNVFNHIWNFSD